MELTQLDWCENAVMLSPRLAWLKKHRLQTKRQQLPRCSIGPFNTKPRTCCDYGMILGGFGDDEHEAILDYCEKFGVRHWLVEDIEPHVTHWTAGEDEEEW